MKYQHPSMKTMCGREQSESRDIVEGGPAMVVACMPLYVRIDKSYIVREAKESNGAQSNVEVESIDDADGRVARADAKALWRENDLS